MGVPNYAKTICVIVTVFLTVLFVGGYFWSDINIYLKHLPQKTWKLMETREHLENSSITCSLDILKEHALHNGFFPSKGRWVRENGTLNFSPDICKFGGQQPNSEFLNTCFTKRNLNKILIMGDSNGKQYYRSFVGILKSSGYQCRMNKTEGGGMFKSDAEYFTKDTGIKLTDVRTQTRGCRTCKSELQYCKAPSDLREDMLEVSVEFILMEFYLDAEIITFRTGAVGNCPKAPQTCRHSSTYQEFIFMEYLRGNYPDLVMIFGNSHSLRRKQLFQIKPSMSMLVSVVQNTVPKTTPVIWLSGTGEYEPKRPSVWRNSKFGPQNNTAQEMIHKINMALFETLRPTLGMEASNDYAFFDLQIMSEDVLAKWSTDGIHMNTGWYQLVVSYLLQSLCNSRAVEKLRQKV